MRTRFGIGLLGMAMLVFSAAPASAEQNWVDQFLSRYRPPAVEFPGAPTPSQQELMDMIRNGQLPLTPNDVINLLLNNNLDVGLNRLTPLSSQYLLHGLYRPFEPALHLSAGVTRNKTPSANQFSALDSVLLSHSYTFGYTQALPTGTNLEVDLSLNRSSSNSPFATFNPSWTGNVKYSFVQHLLKDFGRNINTRQIRIAQNNESISRIQFEQQVINLVVQAQKTYWDLVFSAEDIRVKQRSMELAQKTLSENQIQVNIGTLAPIDLVQAESEVAFRREALVVSTFAQTQSEDQVKKLITSQSDPGMVLARLAPMQPAKRPVNGDVPGVEEAIRIALENRPEMRQLAMELKNKDIDVEYTRNQLLPAIDVSGSYTQNGIGGTLTQRAGFGGPTIAVVPGGLGDTLHQLFGYNYTGFNLGVNVLIPLRNRAAQADNARAATEKRIAENRLSSIAQQIALDVRNALTQVEMNRARIDAAEKARELAERRLQSEQKKFDLGASTIRFVLEEQRNVTQAQTNEIAALVNYTKALVDFDRAAGLTLRKNNIQIDKTLNLPASGK